MSRRHSSLVPLSKDHFDGLLLAHQLRESRPIMKNWPASEADRGSFVARFYREHLASHFLAEEESLFPLIVAHVPAGKPLVEELLREHRQIERAIGRFEQQDSPATGQMLEQFGELLEGHIRKEERQLFPMFEQQAPPDVLAAAEKQIQRHYPERQS